MDDQKDRLKSQFKDQSKTETNTSRPWMRPQSTARQGQSGMVKTYTFFGLEQGNGFVRRLKIFLRGGRMISLPYAYLPLIIYDPNQNLILKTSEIEVTIMGRALKVLAEWLSEEKVLWIRESDSGIDDGDSAVFIAAIQVEGDLIM